VKVTVLTSSRAEYSIYLPLLNAMREDNYFDVSIIAFGTHTSIVYGHTVDAIKKDGFQISYELQTCPETDSSESIADSMGKTISEFAGIWPQHQTDLVLCLGDRYEMFAACASTLPFNIPLGHIHGGETTLGAIDNAFRHSISHMSHYHFASTEVYKQRIIELKQDSKHVYNVGALSFDNLRNLDLLNINEFENRYGINMSKPTLLITVHPETIALEKNETYIQTFLDALNELEGYQYLITMPNADTMGNMLRGYIDKFIKQNPAKAWGYENLGTIGYLSAMKHCALMIGNTSSGMIEAAWFPKWVVNLGDRQKGRLATANVVSIPFNKTQILETVTALRTKQLPAGSNVYGDGHTTEKIIAILKQLHGPH
jgi:GDP/UDP-N,N'-diacetylbacillosamine 2-epimerase (hydrolysing)